MILFDNFKNFVKDSFNLSNYYLSLEGGGGGGGGGGGALYVTTSACTIRVELTHWEWNLKPVDCHVVKENLETPVAIGLLAYKLGISMGTRLYTKKAGE